MTAKEKRAARRAARESRTEDRDDSGAWSPPPARMDAATRRAVLTVVGSAVLVIAVGSIALVGYTRDAGARRECAANGGTVVDVHGGGWICLGEGGAHP